jgi:hypothetical protein
MAQAVETLALTLVASKIAVVPKMTDDDPPVLFA